MTYYYNIKFHMYNIFVPKWIYHVIVLRNTNELGDWYNNLQNIGQQLLHLFAYRVIYSYLLNINENNAKFVTFLWRVWRFWNPDQLTSTHVFFSLDIKLFKNFSLTFENDFNSVINEKLEFYIQITCGVCFCDAIDSPSTGLRLTI